MDNFMTEEGVIDDMPRRKKIIINPYKTEYEEMDRSNVISPKKRNHKNKESSEKKKKNNHKNMVRNFVRKVEANFYSGAYMVTIENVGSNVEEAKKSLARYRRRLKSAYLSNGRELKWIAVLHRGKNGSLHYHIIILACSEIDKATIKQKWTGYTGGYCDVDMIVGQDGLRMAAIYMIKGALQCDPTDPEYRKGARAYSATNNLLSPIISYERISAKEFGQDPRCIKGMYVCDDRRYVDSSGFRHHNYTYRALDEDRGRCCDARYN